MNKRTSPRVGFFTLSAAVLALGLLPAIAGASVLLNETFPYADGNLVGNGTWANHSGSGFFIQVSSQQAVLEQGSGSREDANVTLLKPIGLTDKGYVSFKVNVTAAPSLGGGDYFAHFRSSSDFVYPARIYVGPPLAGGDFTFGLSGTSTGTTPIVWWGSDFSFNSVHTIVAEYNAADGSTRLWVDPSSESSTSISSVGGPAAANAVDQYALRQGSSTTSQQVIDDLVVGTAFASVLPPYAPSLSQWGAMALALGLIGVGGVYVARRRRALA